MTFYDEGYYEGDFIKSKPDGIGVLLWFGHKYEGAFKGGHPSGLNIHTNPFGDVKYELLDGGVLVW